jgi:hypothetical protein
MLSAHRPEHGISGRSVLPVLPEPGYNRLHSTLETPIFPWFIATQPFTPDEGERWLDYVAWSGLTHLQEVVTLDSMLCPTLLPEIKDEYWPYIVQESFMIRYFLDFDFLMAQVAAIPKKNVLCVFRNPIERPQAPPMAQFRFLGYDVVDIQGMASVLTNCRGFHDVFANSELSSVGLLPELERAIEVQAKLRSTHSGEHHSDCHMWAIFRAIEA